MDRSFERLFNKASARVNNEVDRIQKEFEEKSNGSKAGEQEPEAAPDAIKRILDCWDKKDYFKLIQLAEPTADELGRPVWSCTAGDVSRAYRKLSVLVHPDKNPGDDARRAFEALNETHRMLKDPSRLEEVLRTVAARVRLEREREESRVASSDARAALNASKNARAKELRKEEGRSFQDTIVEQMRKKQEEARRRMEAASKARVAALHEAEEEERRAKAAELLQSRTAEDGTGGRGAGSKRAGDGDEDSEGSGDERARARQLAAMRKRKKPTFMH